MGIGISPNDTGLCHPPETPVESSFGNAGDQEDQGNRPLSLQNPVQRGVGGTNAVNCKVDALPSLQLANDERARDGFDCAWIPETLLSCPPFAACIKPGPKAPKRAAACWHLVHRIFRATRTTDHRLNPSRSASN